VTILMSQRLSKLLGGIDLSFGIFAEQPAKF
jgi:hypothetical protein